LAETPPSDPSQTFVIACATVFEEMAPHLPPGMGYQILEFGLHANPPRLRESLQAAIDALYGQYEWILLGYGLCSQALSGIKANGCKLVIPRVHDCIAIFLGSHAAYCNQSGTEPGSYYLTKGWIEAGDLPFADYDRLLEKYGLERAMYILKVMLGNYTRLALINTGQYELERYREYSRAVAEQFNLRYEEIDGSDALVKKLVHGPWDEEFIVLQEGESFRLEQFLDWGKK
jgi:hypothetical protein